MANTGARPADDLSGLAARLGGLTRWRRRFVAILAGAVAALALPPMHALPLLIPGFCVLVWMLAAQPSRRAAFMLGFWFGFGHHVAGLYWLAWPMTLDLARFGWMIPFAVFGLSALLALFTGASTLAAHVAGGRGLRQIVYLAVAWAGFEWLRGFVLTGFPWNLIATGWVFFDLPVQAASVIGPYGLSLVTILIVALPAVWWIRRPGRRAASVASLALLLALIAFGWARLPGGDAPVLREVRLRIVQGHVPQALKWARSARERFFNLYVELSRQPGFDRVTHVIWPETAIHYRFETGVRSLAIDGSRLRRIRRAVPANGSLIAGMVRDDGQRAWNSVQAVDATGKVIATYDKHHLVPFGEYVPLRGVLKSLGVERIAHGRFDFTPGPGPRTVTIPGAPGFSPLICYEAIFPHETVGAKRPGWLLNVTNDAWFGTTSGPYQHLAAARLRAVEQGLPLVRAANTGISVVTDPYGRVVVRLGLGERGIIDSQLPAALPQPPLYARFGDWVLLALSLLVVFLAQIPRSQKTGI